MKVIKLGVSIFLAFCLLIGAIAALTHVTGAGNVVELLKPPLERGGTLHTYHTFEDVSLDLSPDGVNYKLLDSDGNLSNTQFYRQEGFADFELSNGKAVYLCNSTGAKTTYPNFKLRSNLTSDIYLTDVQYIMADIDVEWNIVAEDGTTTAEFKMLFNLRNKDLNKTCISTSLYFNVLEEIGYSGKTHLTFIFEKSDAIKESKIYVYNNGMYLATIENYFLSDITPDFFSCLNIRLPRTAGSRVSIDNFELRTFEPGYSGAMVDYLKDPTDPLKRNSDSIFYKL